MSIQRVKKGTGYLVSVLRYVGMYQVYGITVAPLNDR